MVACDVGEGMPDVVIFFHDLCHPLVNILEFDNQEEVLCLEQLENSL
jgi:hypothetical protein